jgi:hypothetical protein
MAVEHFEAERDALRMLQAVAGWAALRGSGDDGSTPRGASFSLLGAGDATPPRLVTLVPEAALEAPPPAPLSSEAFTAAPGNYWQVDPITRASETMAECARSAATPALAAE